MTVEIDEPLKFAGRAYAGIEQIGFTADGHFVVDLWTTPAPEPRGGWFTCLPISTLAYRKTHKTRTSVADFGSDISIADDYGTCYTIEASRPILDALLIECEANEVPLVCVMAAA
ncbi:MAG: hypothetical protein JWQ01_4821 [Massilia sp.]|nr:hypothetical protein [Massilia sp.]